MIMKLLSISLLTLILLVQTYPLAHAIEQEDIDTLIKDNSTFAFNLYRELCISNNNMFFSPYGISVALAVVNVGTRGNTKKQISETLRFSLPQNKLNSAFSFLKSRLNEHEKSESLIFSSEISLWPQDSFPLKDDYLNLAKKYYDVSVIPIDYLHSPESASKQINAWIKDATKGKILNIVSPNSFDELTRLTLLNAIYFRAIWDTEFDPELTKIAPFYLSSKNIVEAPMMVNTYFFKHAECESLDILELPYVYDHISMFVLLPKAIDGIKHLEENLSFERLQLWMSQLEYRKVSVFLPKFKIQNTLRLDAVLNSMGISDAFHLDKANFTGMIAIPEWLLLRNILQKTYVDVNEKGTEAYAVDLLEIPGEMRSDDEPHLFRADHPFIFFIQENTTGNILFIGRVFNPTRESD